MTLLEVGYVFIILMWLWCGSCVIVIVMGSWVCTYVKIYQILHFRKKNITKRKYWVLYHSSLTAWIWHCSEIFSIPMEGAHFPYLYLRSAMSFFGQWILAGTKQGRACCVFELPTLDFVLSLKWLVLSHCWSFILSTRMKNHGAQLSPSHRRPSCTCCQKQNHPVKHNLDQLTLRWLGNTWEINPY